MRFGYACFGFQNEAILERHSYGERVQERVIFKSVSKLVLRTCHVSQGRAFEGPELKAGLRQRVRGGRDQEGRDLMSGPVFLECWSLPLAALRGLTPSGAITPTSTNRAVMIKLAR